MTGFTKLFSCITTSSIWNESDKTRIVWVTMLALAGPDGIVRASVGGLAHAARVDREDCQKALDSLSNPDPDSRSPEFEGRRIEKVDGGFMLLNFGKYRNARSSAERGEYMRQYMQGYRKQRVNKRKHLLTRVSRSKPQLAKAEAEAEAEAEQRQRQRQRQRKTPAERGAEFLESLKTNPGYAGIDIEKELARMDAWLLTPKGRGRKKTPQFIFNWLNRCQPELPKGNNKEIFIA